MGPNPIQDFPGGSEFQWVPKNWCFGTVVLEKTLESPLNCKEISPVHPKGNQSWIFLGRTDAEAEVPILWPPDAKNWLIGKDPDAGRDWGQEKRGQQRMRWLDGITDSMTWVWVNSGSWWWTGRPGVLWFMGLQRVGHNWDTELNWTGGSDSKECVYNSGDQGSIPGLERYPGEGKGYPLQYSCW